MLILVSNDDGIQSPGLKILTRYLKKIPKSRVIVVAPEREQSASSHALTLHRPLRVTKIKAGFYAVDGTPTDAVMLGVHVVLKEKPSLVVSGINRGANLGEDVHYSGTVAAAMEGAIMGIPSIAVSLVGSGSHSYSFAAQLSLKLARTVLKKGLPRGVVLNVNVPPRLSREAKRIVATCLGKHNYGDVIIEKTDPRGRPYYWIGGNPSEFIKKSGSDGEAYLKGLVSITPIQADLTDVSFLKKLNSWRF